MKSERKRLKCEKIELLNQMRDLYKAIETKENEIGDVLKAYEMRTRETSFAVKRIIDGKVELEREKSRLELRMIELVEEKSELDLLVESKNATIAKLQKQVFELKSSLSSSSSSSQRNSLGKDSDCGYSSSSAKSHDTLSSSLLLGTQTNPISNDLTTPIKKVTASMSACKLTTSKLRASSKEERTLKCKSNDSFRSIYVKNSNSNSNSGGQVAAAAAVVQRSTNQLEINKPTTSLSSTSHVTSPGSLTLDADDDVMSRALVGDSDEFIDLDDSDEDGINNKTTTTAVTPNNKTVMMSSLVCSSSKSITVQPNTATQIVSFMPPFISRQLKDDEIFNFKIILLIKAAFGIHLPTSTCGKMIDQ